MDFDFIFNLVEQTIYHVICCYSNMNHLYNLCKLIFEKQKLR